MQINVRRIKIAMMDKDMTAQRLADQVGVHPATISRWLNEPTRPQLEDINKMAQALGLDAKEIVNDEEAGA